MVSSTKRCPKCRSAALILLYSVNLKICSECMTEIPWTLDEGQKSMLSDEIGVTK